MYVSFNQNHLHCKNISVNALFSIAICDYSFSVRKQFYVTIVFIE